MPLSQSQLAIGAVGELLGAQLQSRTSATTVDVGRPQTAATGSTGPKFNLFLYQVDLDPHLRNQPLDQGQQPPLWLVLRYLVTAFDTNRSSDSADAHRLLGEGMRALQELNFLQPTVAELADNPQSLKITFDETDTELISRLMQGGQDDPYRLSVGFQVRPVLIAPGEPPSYAPLVRSVGQPEQEGVAVIPALAPQARGLDPLQFEAGDTLWLAGDWLDGATEVCFGSTCFGVSAQQEGRIRIRVPADTTLSPGSHTVAAVVPRDGHLIRSNAVLGVLRPRVTGATPGGLTDEGGGLFSGTLTVQGDHLGNADDDIYVAFCRGGEVSAMVEGAGVADQQTVTAAVSPQRPLAAGRYRIILRANGAQALNMPEVEWS